jgi:hypothetical protein
MRETQKFILDTLAHHPHLKLEWISVNSERVIQVVRNEPASKGTDKKDKKGKGKAAPLTSPYGASFNDTLPMILSMEGWGSDDSSDDDIEDELKVTMQDNLQFYDVWGVKSFEQQILLGKL